MCVCGKKKNLKHLQGVQLDLGNPEDPKYKSHVREMNTLALRMLSKECVKTGLDIIKV